MFMESCNKGLFTAKMKTELVPLLSWNQIYISRLQELCLHNYIVALGGSWGDIRQSICLNLWAIRRWLIKMPNVQLWCTAMVANRVRLPKGRSHLPQGKAAAPSGREEGWMNRWREGQREGCSHLQTERKPLRCHNPSLSVRGGEATLTSIHNPLHCLLPSVWFGLWHGVFIRKGRGMESLWHEMLIQHFLSRLIYWLCFFTLMLYLSYNTLYLSHTLPFACLVDTCSNLIVSLERSS